MEKLFSVLVIVILFNSCSKLNKEKTVIIKEYYETGKTKAEYEISADSTKHGKQVYYYPNGNKKSIIFWKNGIKEGEVLQFYESGQLEFKGKYKNGNLIGDAYVFFLDGKIKQHAYYKDGKNELEFISFYPNGNPEFSGKVYNGIRVGDFIVYRQNDSASIEKIIHKTCWEGKETNSYFSKFDINGNLVEESKLNVHVAKKENDKSYTIAVNNYILDSVYIVVGYNTCFSDSLFSLDTLKSKSNKFEFSFPESFSLNRHDYLGGVVFNIEKNYNNDGKHFTLKEIKVPFYIKMPECVLPGLRIPPHWSEVVPKPE